MKLLEIARVEAEITRLEAERTDLVRMRSVEVFDPTFLHRRTLRAFGDGLPRPMVVIPENPELSFWIEKGHEPVELRRYALAQLVLEFASSPGGVSVGSDEHRYDWRELRELLPHVWCDERGGRGRKARMRESSVPFVWCLAPALLLHARKADARARKLQWGSS